MTVFPYSVLIHLIKGSKGQCSGLFFGRLLHGSVITAEMPDVMCSLETFVTDKVLWQESLFLVTVPEHNRRQENYELSEHIRKSVFQFWKPDLADGGDVGHWCIAHLPCHRQKNGAEPAFTHGLWCHSGQSAAVRCHHAGRYRRPHFCPV